MYTIKQTPEDFVVKEIIDLKLDDKGEYSYWLVKKIDYDTLKAVNTIAEKLRIKPKDIGFAGNKDKTAITEQVISIKNVKKEIIERLTLKDIELRFLGQGDKPISLGDNKGNEFKIVIRNLEKKDFSVFFKKIKEKFDIDKLINDKSVIDKTKEIQVPNYFGEQRFSKHNIERGRAIIKRDFKKVAEIDGLEVKDNDYIKAIRSIPPKISKLYVHAYQSFLFNKCINQYLNKKNIKVPIIGFGTELENYPKEIQKITETLMKKEKLTFRDFIIKQIPELSSEGNERDLFIELKDLNVSIAQDELNEGNFKSTLCFSLPKGCYATVVVDYLFS